MQQSAACQDPPRLLWRGRRRDDDSPPALFNRGGRHGGFYFRQSGGCRSTLHGARPVLLIIVRPHSQFAKPGRFCGKSSSAGAGLLLPCEVCHGLGGRGFLCTAGSTSTDRAIPHLIGLPRQVHLPIRAALPSGGMEPICFCGPTLGGNRSRTCCPRSRATAPRPFDQLSPLHTWGQGMAHV